MGAVEVPEAGSASLLGRHRICVLNLTKAGAEGRPLRLRFWCDIWKRESGFVGRRLWKISVARVRYRLEIISFTFTLFGKHKSYSFLHGNPDFQTAAHVVVQSLVTGTTNCPHVFMHSRLQLSLLSSLYTEIRAQVRNSQQHGTAGKISCALHSTCWAALASLPQGAPASGCTTE